MGVRFLDLARPFGAFLPQVEPPQRKIPFNQRILWTAVVLMVFLVMGEIPLFGIISSDESDPLMWLRMMMASNRGTLMELGITPIVTSGMVLQMLTGTGILNINNEDKADRELLGICQKLLAVMLAMGQAIVYVYNGMYGPPAKLGMGVCLLLITQLMISSLIIILLDELLQKGYGLGSGISLFITTNVCESTLWKILSPNTSNSGRGSEFEGALVSTVHKLSTFRDKRLAFVESFTRDNHPNLLSFGVTVVVFLVIVYLQTLKYEIPLRSLKAHAAVGAYPVRLFYTSNTPIMLQSALVSNVFLISQTVYNRWPESVLARILGIWDAKVNTGGLHAVSGVSYYLQAPETLREFTADPIKSVIYIAFVLGACAIFSKTWSEMSGTSAKDIARQLKDQNLGIVGVKDHSARRELEHIIPVAAAIGGATIGLISVLSDLFGSLHSGTGILMAVTTIYGYVEMANKEGFTHIQGL